MKRFLLFSLFIVITFLFQSVLADSWDDLSNVDKLWDGQKSITNQEYEQVDEKLEEKTKEKEVKQKRKKRKKLFGSGTTIHEELNPDNDNIKELESLEPKEDLVINLPVSLIVNNSVLEKGYYKVLPEIDEETKKKYINFYQSQFFKCKIEITETDDDFNEQELNFVKLLPYNESFVKIIFGSLDFNGYVFLPFIE